MGQVQLGPSTESASLPRKAVRDGGPQIGQSEGLRQDLDSGNLSFAKSQVSLPITDDDQDGELTPCTTELLDETP